MEVLRTRKLHAILAAVVVISVASFTLLGVVALSNPLPASHKFVYSIKFICNALNPYDAQGLGLAPGFYYTDINVHNPSFAKHNATITQKLVVALPDASPSIPYVGASPNPYLVIPVTLGTDAAMRLDCTYIMSLLQVPQPSLTYAKGFVILYTNIKLDVVAEYTAGALVAGLPSVVSLDTQYIQPQSFTP
ncbi:MAG: hypothetical protein ABSB29_04430 [Nitrososphaerales archaeon]|jgi:hypothetical protein